jgi:serine/threonine protein phosphatase PrpC
MRRPASVVQLRYLEELAACVAAPIPERAPPVVVHEATSEPPPRAVLVLPPRIRRFRRVMSAVSTAASWLLAFGLVLATQHGCSVAFGHDRTAPDAGLQHHSGNKHSIAPTVATKRPLAQQLPPAEHGAALAPSPSPAPAPMPVPEPVPAPQAAPAPPAAEMTPPATPAAEPDRPRRKRRSYTAIAVVAAMLIVAALGMGVAIVRRRWRRGTPVAEVAGPTAEALWTVGFATNPGRVRSRNEDAGTAFCLGTVSVAIVADGLGGMPEGQDASALAVRVAERSIRRASCRAPAGRSPAPAILLHGAFAAASAWLAHEGVRRGFRTPRDGLRTTMIIVIATEDRYDFGYIGDGGLFVVGADGVVRSLMAPQKAEGEALNCLAASLGPFDHGAPVFGGADRAAGDLLIVASDGVADRLQPGFYSDMLRRHIRRCGGDRTAGAARVLAILAGHLDGGLHRFDDNMTLALIGDGRAGEALSSTAATTEAA